MQELVNALYNYDLNKLAEPYGPKLQRFDRLSSYMKIAIRGLSDATVSAMNVAEALYIIKTEELYKDYPIPGTNNSQTFHSGIKDFLSFCKSCFKASKSTVYNNLAIYERFGSVDENNFIFQKIKSFTYTQLTLMLPLTDSELSEITPAWSCSELKKYVKEVKAKREEEQFSNRLENVDEAEAEESFEEYKLNNDERRYLFLGTYERWSKEQDLNILGNRVRFFSCVLSDAASLVCAETSNSEYKFAAFFLFGKEEYHYCYNMSKILNFGEASSQNMIVKYLRDKKIQSVRINKCK